MLICNGCRTRDTVLVRLALPKTLFSALLPPDRQGNDGRHLDIRRRISERAELIWVQEHNRATRTGVEGGRVERPVLAFDGHDVPPIKTADATAPLSGRSPHGRSVASIREAGKSSNHRVGLLDAHPAPARVSCPYGHRLVAAPPLDHL